MTNKTQKEWVKEQLLQHGKVSRNQALSIYISRLGAIIYDLNKDGWKIVGEIVPKNGGKDYVYTLNPAPDTYENEKN